MKTDERDPTSQVPGRHSIRLRGYDYSREGGYFVTACTRAKLPYFENHPQLKDILESEWRALPGRFPTVIDDAFVVMPNHVHGILLLSADCNNVGATLEVARRAGSSPAPTIGQIIGAFKSVCVNRWAQHLLRNHATLKTSFWQRNYYEHVIRDEDELNLLRQYITFNPLRWSADLGNPNRVDDREYEKEWQWLEDTRTARVPTGHGGASLTSGGRIMND